MQHNELQQCFPIKQQGAKFSKPLPSVIKERKKQKKRKDSARNNVCFQWKERMYVTGWSYTAAGQWKSCFSGISRCGVSPTAPNQKHSCEWSKHAHLHKYAVKHTLVAPGCGFGDGTEASPASRLTSHWGCYAKERERKKRKEKKSKQNVGRCKTLSEKLTCLDRMAFFRSGWRFFFY